MWSPLRKSSNTIFVDRADAGHQLADILTTYNFELPPLILALPRGGVIVGYEIASRLNAPLELLIVTKIGAPHQPELALGAIVEVETPQIVWNEDMVKHLGITNDYKQQIVKQKISEIRKRQEIYCYSDKRSNLHKHTVILVDDGIATGATVRVAMKCLKKDSIQSLVLAIPVAPSDTISILQNENEADKIVCLHSPLNFVAVGNYYHDFSQITDEQVNQKLIQFQLPK